MINASQIKPNAPVVCSNDGQVGIVDHMEGQDAIKMQKDAKGQHHYLPLSWVRSVDNKIHLDRPGDQATREWFTTAEAASRSGTSNTQGTQGKGAQGQSQQGNSKRDGHQDRNAGASSDMRKDAHAAPQAQPHDTATSRASNARLDDDGGKPRPSTSPAGIHASDEDSMPPSSTAAHGGTRDRN